MKIEPTYCTFEQSKLLKERGFDEECKTYYNGDLEVNYFWYYAGDGTGVDKNSTCVNNDLYDQDVVCMAPEQWMVVEWLRVNHNIDVIVLPYFTLKNTKCYHYEITTDGLKEISNQENRFLKVMQASHQDIPGNYIDDDLLEVNLFTMGFAFETPQEAYSAAIDYVLTNIL